MTDEQRQQKKEELLNALKEEIFVELDRRIRETEKSLSNEITQVEETFEEKYGEEIVDHLQDTQKWRNKVKEDIQSIQTRFSYYRLPYAAIVVAGFMLFWYGAFSLIPQIPYISDGLVAIIAGLILLLATGAAHKKLVG